jgi:quercetin dioxygenase-like cupin family protein
MGNHRSIGPRLLLRSEESEGRIALVEIGVPPRWEGPPLHHHAFDEAFHVLEGELTFRLGDELRTAAAGQLAFVPGGRVHTLANLADAPARYLLVITPAGFERYFQGLRDGGDPPGPVPETTVVGPPIDPGAGATAPPLPPRAARIDVRVTGADSDGRVAVMDNRIGPGRAGPPLHHHAFDEAFYVLEGELTFQLDGQRLTRRPGELAFARGGVHHTFANLSAGEARTLIICTPAGFERYFQRIAARETGVEPPPEALEPWPEVTKVGPPIA